MLVCANALNAGARIRKWGGRSSAQKCVIQVSQYCWRHGGYTLDCFDLDADPRHLDDVEIDGAEKRLGNAKNVMIKSHEQMAERGDAP